MLSYIKLIGFIVISALIFSTLFLGLNKSLLRLFVPIQKVTNKLKRKRLIEKLCLVVFIVFCVFIKDIYDINDIFFGLMTGFFTALNDIIFDNTLQKTSK